MADTPKDTLFLPIILRNHHQPALSQEDEAEQVELDQELLEFLEGNLRKRRELLIRSLEAVRGCREELQQAQDPLRVGQSSGSDQASLEKLASRVQKCRDRLVRGLYSQKLAQDAVDGLVLQLETAKEFTSKHMKPRPFWTVPQEVWLKIFRMVVQPDYDLPDETEQTPRGWVHGSRSMILGSVCHLWRSLVLTDHSLWGSTAIDLQQSVDHARMRIRLYLERSNRQPHTIIIVGRNCTTLSESCVIQDLFQDIEYCDTIQCRADMISSPCIDRLLLHMPAPTTIVLRGEPVGGTKSRFLLPEKIIRRIERFDICGCNYTWYDEHDQLFRPKYVDIRSGLRDIAMEGVWNVPHVWAPAMAQSVMHFAFDMCLLKTDLVKERFPVLTTIEMALDQLVLRLANYAVFPLLRNLIILRLGRPCMEEWKVFTKNSDKGGLIQHVTLRSSNENGGQDLVPYLGRLPRLMDLRLERGCVERFLSKILDTDAFPTYAGVRYLTVADYNGTGEILVRAVERWADVTKPQGIRGVFSSSEKPLPFHLDLEGCSRLSDSVLHKLAPYRT